MCPAISAAPASAPPLLPVPSLVNTPPTPRPSHPSSPPFDSGDAGGCILPWVPLPARDPAGMLGTCQGSRGGETAGTPPRPLWGPCHPLTPGSAFLPLLPSSKKQGREAAAAVPAASASSRSPPSRRRKRGAPLSPPTSWGHPTPSGCPPAPWSRTPASLLSSESGGDGWGWGWWGGLAGCRHPLQGLVPPSNPGEVTSPQGDRVGW